MVVTTMTCDRCGVVVEKYADLFKVAIAMNYGYNWDASANPAPVEWCRNCCVEKHLLREQSKTTAKPCDPPPTIEDMIREIVRQEMPFEQPK